MKNLVILKADDFLLAGKERLQERLDKFQKFITILANYGAKASLGIIGSTVIEVKDSQLEFLKEALRENVIQLYNHSYHHMMPDNLKFYSDVDTQLNNIKDCNKVILDKFGVDCIVYGGAANFHTSASTQALKKIPDITHVYLMRDNVYYPFLYREKKIVEINGYRELENLVEHSYIQWGNFISKYQKSHDGYKTYQLHPSQWSNKEFEIFETIIDMMQRDGKQFIFPTEI